jgi:hypothetical protein
VVGFDPVVGVLAGVVVHASQRSTIVRARAGDRSVVTSAGPPWVLIAVEKNRVAAVKSRFFETITSMTCPFWSTARYTYRQVPATFT